MEIQLINDVLEWERALTFEEESRKDHRSEPSMNFLARPRPHRKERMSRLARIFTLRQEGGFPSLPLTQDNKGKGR